MTESVPQQQFNITNNQINVNNIESNEELRMKDALRSCSAFANCTGCGNMGLSTTEKSCSCASICCCIWFSIAVWLCYQACRSKDINCYDAKHTCSKCGKVLNVYQAC